MGIVHSGILDILCAETVNNCIQKRIDEADLHEPLLAAEHGEDTLGVCFQVDRFELIIAVSWLTSKTNILHAVNTIGSHFLRVVVKSQKIVVAVVDKQLEGTDFVSCAFPAFHLGTHVADRILQILESNLLRRVNLSVQMSAHCVVDGGDVVQDTSVVGLHSVNKERIVLDSGSLFFTDKITNDIHEPLRLTFGNELGRVDTFSQKSHVGNLELALPHIETLLVLIVENGLQFVDFFFIAGLRSFLEHHVHFVQVDVLLEHEHDSVDVLNVSIDGAAFRRNAAALQIADDVVCRLGVVFVGVFDAFKKQLVDEINALHVAGMPKVERLNALVGGYINLECRLPNGKPVKFLDDSATYLGTQLVNERDGSRCFGIAANAEFILVCSYEENGENPELVVYRKR